MEIKLILAALATFIAVIAIVPYIVDIFRKTTQPHTYSWLIWTILQAMAAIAGFQDGAGYGILGIAFGAILCFSVFILSLFYGTKNITKFDQLCLIAALTVIVLYVFQRDPLITVILVTLIDFISFLPTMRKTWEEPGSETASTYALSALAVLLGIFALQNYTFITMLYLTSLVLTNSALVFIILLRKRT